MGAKHNTSVFTFSIALAVMLSGCYMRIGAADLYQEADDPARIFSLLAAFSDSDQSLYVYKLYPGAERASSERVGVRLEGVDAVVVDGLTVDRAEYQEVHLLPGRHAFTWSKGFGFSVMVEPEMHREAAYKSAVEMQAGHTYALHGARTYGEGYRFYFWIEDLNSGEVVAGTKKP